MKSWNILSGNDPLRSSSPDLALYRPPQIPPCAPLGAASQPSWSSSLGNVPRNVPIPCGSCCSPGMGIKPGDGEGTVVPEHPVPKFQVENTDWDRLGGTWGCLGPALLGTSPGLCPCSSWMSPGKDTRLSQGCHPPGQSPSCNPGSGNPGYFPAAGGTSSPGSSSEGQGEDRGCDSEGSPRALPSSIGGGRSQPRGFHGILGCNTTGFTWGG